MGCPTFSFSASPASERGAPLSISSRESRQESHVKCLLTTRRGKTTHVKGTRPVSRLFPEKNPPKESADVFQCYFSTSWASWGITHSATHRHTPRRKAATAFSIIFSRFPCFIRDWLFSFIFPHSLFLSSSSSSSFSSYFSLSLSLSLIRSFVRSFFLYLNIIFSGSIF